MKMTDDGHAMIAELDYGHNPQAYLCRERPDDQPHVAHALCVLCSDGFEALTWKRRALRAEAVLRELRAEE